METNTCKRNCWIAGGVLGLLILIFGASGFGFVGALFLSILAGVMLGATLQWLACDGAGGPAHGQVAEGPDGGETGRQINIDRHDHPEGHEVALMGSGAGRFGSVVPVGELAAPTAIVAGARETMSEGAVAAVTGQPQAPTFGQSSGPTQATRQTTPEPLAGDSPVEDTRAVQFDPSQSENHDMPGEAVPVAEPGGAQDEQPPRAGKAAGDKPKSTHKRSGKVRVTEAGNEG